MATSFRQRLQKLKKDYSLTTSDLGVLLDSNRSTVLAWERGVKPSLSKGPLIEKRLAMIDKAKKLFPVPLHVTQYQRKTYLLDALNVFPSKLSKSGSSAGK
jgi:DNA-binding XRE family transcriptional regulator